jgi:hypothetical protein
MESIVELGPVSVETKGNQGLTTFDGLPAGGKAATCTRTLD